MDENDKDKRVNQFNKDFRRDRRFEIEVLGRGDEYVKNEVRIAMRRMPASYLSHQEMAKPGTINDSLAMQMYIEALETANPNNVDPHMFLGSYELEREAIAMTARLLHCPDLDQDKPDKEKRFGGRFLNGGTESIIQATWIYRNKYFSERFVNIKAPSFIKKYVKDYGKHPFLDLFSLRTMGWFGVASEYQKLFGRSRKVPIPKIVAPFGAHFAVDKAADILGFGGANIAHFYLSDKARPDPESLREAMLKIVHDGDEIAMIWLTFGDTERGVLSNIEELVSSIRGILEDQEYHPPILVDAAAQYLFAAVMRNSDHYQDADSNPKRIPTWDFAVEEVKAIVCDPQKNQIPYPTSILLLRDYHDIRYTIMEEKYLSLRSTEQAQIGLTEVEDSQHNATIPTSRAGYGAVATWAYYVGHGLIEIRRRKEKIWSLVIRLRNAIKSGKLSHIYKLVCEPDSAIVSFYLSKEWLDEHKERVQAILQKNNIAIEATGYLNMLIDEGIRFSDKDKLYIGRSPELRIKTENEHKDYKAKQAKRYINEVDSNEMEKKVYDYEGLIAHIMEHTREEDIDLLIERLQEEANKLVA